MKDSYSFDLVDEGLETSYRAHRDAYERIFTRLGMTYKIVFAVSGAMGGSASEEFLAPAASGEDTFVQCTNCDYAANTEAVEIAAPEPTDPADHPAEEVLDTPDTPTIDTLVARMNELGLGDVTAADTLKNVVLRTRSAGRGRVAAAGRRRARRPRGRPQADRRAARAGRGRAGRPRGPGQAARSWSRATSARSCWPSWKIRYLVDPLVVEGSAWVTGANEPGKHAAYVVRGRDFTPDGEIGAVEIRDGDRCARCGSPLEIARGIEMGHVFQLGTKYAETFGLTALDQNGKPVDDHDGLLRRRRHPRRRRDRRADLRREGAVLAASARRRPTSTSSRPARTTRCSPRPTRSPPSSRRPGVRVHVRRPARRVAGREVQGRRADRRADDRHRRQGPRRRRRRAARPAHRRARATSRSPTPRRAVARRRSAPMPDRRAVRHRGRSPIYRGRSLAGGGIPSAAAASSATRSGGSRLRPAEGGRYAVRRPAPTDAGDVLPAPWNARTRVHEYGGGAWTATPRRRRSCSPSSPTSGCTGSTSPVASPSR